MTPVHPLHTSEIEIGLTGYSAEQIAVPHQFQPYGDLFVMKLDGTGLTRLTHDPYENGTPQWGATTAPASFAPDDRVERCQYDDQDVRSTGQAVCGGEKWYTMGQLQKDSAEDASGSKDKVVAEGLPRHSNVTVA